MLLYNSIEEKGRDHQQRILPSMNFSCSGNISKWTFVAWSRTGGQHNQYPRFQLWRPNGTGIYRRVYESSDMSTMSGPSEFTVEEYIPDDPVPFEAGFVFGLYQSEHAESRRLSVRHVAVPDGYGFDNYHRDNNMMPEVFNTSGLKAANNYPLVAVETSEYQKTLSDKQRGQHLCENFCKIQARRYGQSACLPMCKLGGFGGMHPDNFLKLNTLRSILRPCLG